MQLNHINLCVDNLTEACTFFQNCFDFQFVEQKGEALAVMTDGHGFTLVLSNPRAFGKELPLSYPEGFHIGFLLETSEQVDRTYQRLTAANIPLPKAPGKMRGGYSFYFTALNELLIEVSSPL